MGKTMVKYALLKSNSGFIIRGFPWQLAIDRFLTSKGHFRGPSPKK
jgi:hypothetical protein